MNTFIRIARNIDHFHTKLAEKTCWLLLGMVILTFFVVVLRYFFNIGWIWIQESILYLHGFLFLLMIPPTLLKNGHVRVDLFYQKCTPETQKQVDFLGALFFLLPTCGLIFYESLPYVIDSWSVLEKSKETGGLPLVFLQKTTLLIFCSLTALQGISLMIHCLTDFSPKKLSTNVPDNDD